MKERLRELMLEAGYASPEIAGRAIKLAQLIVQKCVLISRTSTDGFSAGRRMEELFGVEE